MTENNVQLKKKEIPMKIHMFLTAHDKLGDTGLNTGFWLEEFASPYYVFKDRNIIGGILKV